MTDRARRRNVARVRWAFLAALGLALAARAAGADEVLEPTPRGADRPRVGLVLSGGGARGAAHVGVIRVLEELRIPVDFVAGTSMGAVVGGLYASGIGSEELEDLLADLPWDTLFADKTRRRDMSFRRKQDDRDFVSSFHFGFKDGRIRLPTGLIQGQKLELVLGLLTVPVGTVRDFDDLMIPFRAVATDIVTGQPVVLDHGVLATAIRASMAIPAAFSPVVIDDRLLVDGGTAMNLPVEVARDMGADVIIAVDISTPLRTEDQLDTALAVSGQTVTIQIQQNTADQVALLDENDFLIRPDMGRVATLSFDRVVEATQVGEEAAWAIADYLGRLSVDEEAWRRHRAGLVPPDRSPPVIDSVRIDNDSGVSDDVIRSRMKVRAGEPLDLEKLALDIDILYGIDIFDRVNFRIDALPRGGRELVIVARERRTGRTRVRFGVELETDFETTGLFNIGVQVTRMPMNHLAAEWRTELRVGESPGFRTEFWQPLDDETRWFMAPEFEFETDNIGIFDDDGEQFAEYRAWNLGAGLGFGRQLGQWGEIRAGMRYDKARARPIIGPTSIFPDASREQGQVFVRGGMDTLDNARFPRQGTVAFAEGAFSFESLGSEEDYQTLVVAFSQAVTWRDNTLVADLQAATSFDQDPNISQLFTLGGFLRLSGLKPRERVGSELIFARIRGYRRVAKLGVLSFTLPAYVGFSIEGGNTWFGTDEVSFDSMLWGGSVYFALDTPLSPFYIAYGNTDGDRHAAYIFLGQVF
jgi:NTE family protein